MVHIWDIDATTEEGTIHESVAAVLGAGKEFKLTSLRPAYGSTCHDVPRRWLPTGEYVLDGYCAGPLSVMWRRGVIAVGRPTIWRPVAQVQSVPIYVLIAVGQGIGGIGDSTAERSLHVYSVVPRTTELLVEPVSSVYEVHPV